MMLPNYGYKFSKILAIFVIFVLVINVNVTHSEEGLKRKELPIKVRDEVWAVVENIQRVIPLELETDLSRRSGKVTKNVTAQFVVNNFVPKILIFTNDVTEQTLAHELLHAKIVIDGYPVLYRTHFPLVNVIDNLQNTIHHIVIYHELEKLGFEVRTWSIIQWRKDIEILKSSLDKLELINIPKTFCDLIGASHTLSGLIDGIELREIEEKLDKRVKDGIANGKLIHEILLEYNLAEKNDNFRALLKVSNLLGITKSCAAIAIINYKTNTWYQFNPENGQRVSKNPF